MRLRSLLIASALVTGSVAPMFTAGPASAKDKFCDPLVAFSKKLKVMGTATGSDPAATGKALADVAKAMKDLNGKAPSAIKADWTKMSGGITKLSDVTNKMLKLTAADATKELPKLQAEMTKVTSDKSFNTSGDKVTAWAKKNCGINLDA